VKRHGSVAISVRGEVTPERRKREDDASWTEVNLIEQKNEENLYGLFMCCK
jgi:hypothetical protein